jgi:Tol biopolymer transport system component
MPWRLCLLGVATFAVSAASAAVPGRDGRIVFANRGHILSANPDGSGLELLTRGTYDCSPVWSPNGKRIGFARTNRPGFCDDSTYASVFVMTASGGDIHLVARNATWPAWSPDARRFAFYRGNSLYVMRRDGTHQRKLAKSAGSDGPPSGPDWSPDGRWIAFTSRNHLDLIKPDGTGLHEVATRQALPSESDAAGNVCGPPVIADPVWSPSGDRIAYTEELDCNESVSVLGIVSIAPDGADPVVLVDPTKVPFSGPHQNWGGFCPAWSPDGQSITFLYGDNEGDQIGILDLATGTLTTLKHQIEDDDHRGRPDWQPLPAH